MYPTPNGYDSDGDGLEEGAGDEELFEQIRSGQLPVSNETMMALNLTYQEVMQNMLDGLENRLQKSLEKKTNLDREFEVAKGERIVKEWVRVPVLQYIPPYFRDSCGMAPKPNSEAIFKKEQNELNPLVEPAKKWSKTEKNRLMQAIQGALIDKELAPIKEKRNELAAQLKGAGTGEHGKLTDQILKLDNKITNMLSKVEIWKASRDVLEALDWNKMSVTDMKGTRTELECRLAFFNMLRPTLNQEKYWGENELKRLAEIAKRNQLRDWPATAMELGTGRTAFQCFEKYQTVLNHELLKRDWNEADDDKLREAVGSCRMGDYIPWKLVAGSMEGRTRAQCQNRWTRKLDPTLKTGRWDEMEDEILKAAVKKFGVKGWRKISKEVPGRTEAQCRERWSSALRGDIKTGNWTPKEDNLLMEGLKTFGDGKWSKICTLLTGRTPAACKIRYRSLSKSKSPEKKGRQGRKKKVVQKTEEEKPKSKAQEKGRRGRKKIVQEAEPIVQETAETGPIIEETVETEPIVEETVVTTAIVEETVETEPKAEVQETGEGEKIVQDTAEAEPKKEVPGNEEKKRRGRKKKVVIQAVDTKVEETE